MGILTLNWNTTAILASKYDETTPLGTVKSTNRTLVVPVKWHWFVSYYQIECGHSWYLLPVTGKTRHYEDIVVRVRFKEGSTSVIGAF